MSKYTKPIVGVLCLAFIAWACQTQGASDVVGIAKAYAQTPTDFFFGRLLQTTGFILSVLHFLTYIILYLLELLMDPEFVLGITVNAGSGEQLLLRIWRVSRDIMNILFAFMLIAGAIMTVVFAKGDFVSQYAVKFILAVILVNFSWFFPRVIWDIANVMTATVYQLPSLAGIECKWKDKGVEKPCEVIVDYEFFIDDGELAKKPGGRAAWKCPLDEGDDNHLVCIQKEVLTAETIVKPVGILNGLVLNHARLQDLPRVINPGPGPSSKPTFLSNASQTFFVLVHSAMMLVLQIGLFFPLLALLVAFVVRMIIIWLTVAFMPFMFIGVVFGGGFAGIPDTKEFIFGKFVKAVFLPVAVAVAFAVGFIMINAGTTSAPPEGFEKLNNAQGPLLTSISDFWEFLWLIVCIFVIWTGVFSAMKIDEVYANIGERFKAAGSATGKFIAKLPLTWPILPFGKNGMSPLQVFNTAKRLPGLIENTGRMPTNAEDWRKLLGVADSAASPDAARSGAEAVHRRRNGAQRRDLMQDINAINGTLPGADNARVAQAIENLRREARDNRVQFDPSSMRLFADEFARRMGETGFSVSPQFEQRIREAVEGRAPGTPPAGGGGDPPAGGGDTT